MKMKSTDHIFVIFLGCILWIIHIVIRDPPLPVLDEKPWWGPDPPGRDDEAIRPFQIHILQEDIDDLNSRLSIPVRHTSPLQDANFTYGISTDVLETIINYWRSEYSWRSTEERLNNLPQFKTQIEGIDIHFIHMKPNLLETRFKNLTVIPLLMIHGWPGSVAEFDEILPLLSSPQEGSNVVFEVICPSLPGYGFSQAPSKQGLGSLQTSQIFLKLMKRLGFYKFCVQGGDWGALISSTMTTLYPKNVIAMHSNFPVISRPATAAQQILGTIFPSEFIIRKRDEHLFYPLESKLGYYWKESGYLHLQSTKPDTIGAVLSNSPIGLAAYILEKFSSWTNHQNQFKSDGGLLSQDFPIPIDKLLDNISLYWFSQSITTSMRYFRESFGPFFQARIHEISTHVPASFSAFSQEIIIQPEYTLAVKYKYIVSYRAHEKGGHFAAMEQPRILAKDIHDFLTEIDRREKLVKGLLPQDEL